MSIFETIRENLTAEGRLPAGYELPHEEKPPNEIQFMAGALDGMRVFHMGQEDAEEEAASIFEAITKKDTEKIETILSKSCAFYIYSPLIMTINKNIDSIDAPRLALYAYSLTVESDNVELIKLGISILGMFDWSDNIEIQEQLIILGLYEEFTLYVVVAALNWGNANDVIFRIAQNVDGWGKIHAVERLEPETDEIREWILRKGCKNKIMDSYLGLDCAYKGDLIGALKRDEIDDELFESICILMNALSYEGPVTGISGYEYAEEAKQLYLRHASSHAKS